MKQILTVAAVLLASQFSHATTACNINTKTGDDMVFDKILFSSEVSATTAVRVSKGTKSAVKIDLDKLDSYEKWKAIDGSTIVTFSPQDNESFAITVSRVRASGYFEDMLPLEAMAAGPLVNNHVLNLILPKKNLSVVCASQK